MTWRVQLGGAARPSEIVGGYGALSELSDRARESADGGVGCSWYPTGRSGPDGRMRSSDRSAQESGMPAVHLVTPGEASKTVATVGRVLGLACLGGGPPR